MPELPSIPTNPGDAVGFAEDHSEILIIVLGALGIGAFLFLKGNPFQNKDPTVNVNPETGEVTITPPGGETNTPVISDNATTPEATTAAEPATPVATPVATPAATPAPAVKAAPKKVVKKKVKKVKKKKVAKRKVVKKKKSKKVIKAAKKVKPKATKWFPKARTGGGMPKFVR